MMARVSESNGRLVRGFTEDDVELVITANTHAVVVEILRDEQISLAEFHLTMDQWDALVGDVGVMRHIVKRALPVAQQGADIPLVGTQVDEVTDVDAQEPDGLMFPLAYGPHDGA